MSDNQQKNKDIADIVEDEDSSLTEKERRELQAQVGVMTSYYKRYGKIISDDALSREVEGELNGGIIPNKPKLD